MLDKQEWLPIITDALPERHREVITALHFEGLSEDEAAEMLGIARASLRERRDRAVLRMRLYFEALEDFLYAESS